MTPKNARPMGPAISSCISIKDTIIKHLIYSLLETCVYLNMIIIKSLSLKQEHGNRANMRYNIIQKT